MNEFAQGFHMPDEPENTNADPDVEDAVSATDAPRVGDVRFFAGRKIIEGWDAIGRRLGIPAEKVKPLALRRVDPLPLTHHKLGSKMAYVDALDAWADYQPDLAQAAADVSVKNISAHIATAMVMFVKECGLASPKFLSNPGVYCVSFDRCDRMKIGYATDVADRLSGLQTAMPYPVRLLMFTPGPPPHERALHRSLREYHGIGEWYEKHPKAYRIVSAHAREHSGACV